MSGPLNYMKDVGQLGRWAQIKVSAAVIAALLLVWMALLEFAQPSDSGFQNYWADRPFLAGSLFTALIAVIGLVAVATRSEIHRQRINRSASALAVAGLVDPLLRLQLVLRILHYRFEPATADAGAGPKADEDKRLLGLLSVARMAKEDGVKRLKWAQPGLEYPNYFEQVGEDRKLCAKEETNIAKWIIKECVKATAAKVREWSDLLVLTDDGMDALYCLQSLRVQIQQLEREAAEVRDHDAATRCCVISDRAFALAVAFEYASAPMERRLEFGSQSPAIVDPQLAKSVLELWNSPASKDSCDKAWDAITALQKDIAAQ